jgi:hypothetical protein
MKNIITIAILFAGACITTGSISAQTAQVQATIPFNFSVGQATLPAGTYTLRTEKSSPILVIKNASRSAVVVAMSQPDSPDANGKSRLVFHKYGGQYFLSDVRTQHSSMNLHLVPSRNEKRAKAQTLEAGMRSNDPVLVAAN